MEIRVREYEKKDFDGVNIMLYEAFRRLKKTDISENDNVCVIRDFRGYGVGEKMMDYAEEYARHCGGMYLQLTCRWTRIEAHKLYEKCGFVKRESDIFRKELV